MAERSGVGPGSRPDHVLAVHSWANYLKPWDLHVTRGLASAQGCMWG